MYKTTLLDAQENSDREFHIWSTKYHFLGQFEIVLAYCQESMTIMCESGPIDPIRSNEIVYMFKNDNEKWNLEDKMQESEAKIQQENRELKNRLISCTI